MTIIQTVYNLIGEIMSIRHYEEFLSSKPRKRNFIGNVNS